MEVFGVIMAGGGGTRFWPVSRQRRPKQLLNMTGKDLLINETIDRLAHTVAKENLFAVTNAAQAPALAQATAGRLREDRLLIEPCGRDTAACVGYAAAYICAKFGDGIMVVTPSDAYIRDADAFGRTLTAVIREAERSDRLMTIGIRPTFASTGYGYIHFSGETGGIRSVLQFREKPDLQTARRYIESGAYAWNSGMFIWRAGRILEQFRRLAPDIYAKLEEIGASIGTPAERETLERIYPSIRRVSVDYAIMEDSAREGCVAMAEGDFGWSDVGNWDTLDAVRAPDADGNVVVGNVRTLDTAGSVLYGGQRLIAAIGLKDIIAVDTEDALLLCDKAHVQEIKRMVEALRADGLDSLL